MSARPIPAGRRARGRLTPPPSKSLSNRYLNLALLARRRVRIERLLASEDTAAFLRALTGLGWRVERDGAAHRLTPGPPPAGARIECGASGTMLRFLAAALTTLDGRWRVDGVQRLRERPLAPLLSALRALGADLDCLAAEGHAPLSIRGGSLTGGATAIDASLSSQFASALLMAGTRAGGPLEVRLEGLTSAPYLDLTLAAMEAFGAEVERPAEGLFRLRPGLPGAASVRVEGDDSSAAYWAAGAALSAGAVELEGLSRRSRQADRLFLDVLADMGVAFEWRGERLAVTGGAPLEAVDRDLSRLPDQVPTLAVLAPFARGVTRIRGVAHARLKESDRLAGVAAGLEAAGAEVEQKADGLVIPGVWAEREPSTEPVALDPIDDHRLAMSFAILGVGRPGISVCDAGVVAKSYPGFWRDFETVFMP